MTTNEPRDEETDDERVMRNVDHTPPDGDGARPVWERGDETKPGEDGGDASGEAAEADCERVGVADE